MSPEQRLTQLESRCRNLTRALFATAVLGGLALLLGASAVEPPSKLKVTSLEVVDAKGNVRISLGGIKEDQEFFCLKIFNGAAEQQVVINDNGQLSLGDWKGGASVKLGAGDDGGRLQLTGKNGLPRAMIYASEPDKDIGVAGLRLVDSRGEGRFVVDTPRLKRVPAPARVGGEADPLKP